MSDEQQIEEARLVTRVNSKGEKSKKVKCRKGFKRVGNKCVAMSGSEKQSRKKALRKAVRTKRGNPSGQKRAGRKRLKALKKRKTHYGL